MAQDYINPRKHESGKPFLDNKIIHFSYLLIIQYIDNSICVAMKIAKLRMARAILVSFEWLTAIENCNGRFGYWQWSHLYVSRTL